MGWEWGELGPDTGLKAELRGPQVLPGSHGCKGVTAPTATTRHRAFPHSLPLNTAHFLGSCASIFNSPLGSSAPLA